MFKGGIRLVGVGVVVMEILEVKLIRWGDGWGMGSGGEGGK